MVSLFRTLVRHAIPMAKQISPAGWILGVLLLATTPPVATLADTPAPGTVYLVVGSDTAIWDGLDLTRHHCYFLPDLYTLPSRNAYKVMDPAFRGKFSDSFGNPLKMTWWMLVGSLHLDSENIDVPIPNLMPLHLMLEHQGDSLRAYGDEVSLHYHTFLWSDYNHDGVFWWNEALTFHESRYDFDSTLAQSLLEEGVFPVTFRSGWHFMDNEWQARLNEVLPFSLHNDSPNVNHDTTEPLENNLDWSKATTSFVPFHPSPTNYQVAGEGPGWNVRSIKMPNLTQATMDKMFAAAAGGTDQVACLWAHLPEAPFLSDIARVDLYAHVSTTNYPGVQFRYCTAIEAMQRWMKTPDHTPPLLTIDEGLQGEDLTLTLATDEPIFQPQPFVAVKDRWEQYQVVSCLPAGPNRWTAQIPVPRSRLAKIGVAVTDPSGNLTQRLLSYLPGDLHLDDRDPGFLPLEGTWTPLTNNLAWETTSRDALIPPGGVARAGWAFRVAAAGRYHLWTQAPAVTNPVARATFTLRIDDLPVETLEMPGGVPGRQWLPLFTRDLSPSDHASVECRFEGPPDRASRASLDVLRITPLETGPAFISDLAIEPGASSALITWTTPVAATSRVDYGATAAFDQAAAPGLPPVHRHAVTLTGLLPGTPYFFKAESATPDRTAARWGTFVTTRNLVAAEVMSLTNSWRYSTNNLDGVPWTSSSYDDSGWSTGNGVLWVDQRGAAVAGIPALGTVLPLDPSTGFPFVTYYFRGRFPVATLVPGMSLVFSNYLDDGAIYYLNGAEVQRKHLPAAPAVVTGGVRANGYDCSGDATCSTLFSLTPAETAAHLASGLNSIAVEVHNYSAKSPDITFGLALFLNAAVEPPSTLRALPTEEGLLLFWNGGPATLQQSDPGGFPDTWVDVAPGVSGSPVLVQPSGTRFYRLAF
ncbi:MAG TPA: hypothetical protein DCM86_09410 [Verrucomicrobiales bacterium]|nr:hypothetical protein [Verrucomicrobiales bacterium]